MTQPVILSTPLSVSVATVPAAGAFTPPYALPTPGTKLAISTSGRNVANDVKPAPHTNGSWQYALFQSYGGGSFSADYSAAGAYVLAGPEFLTVTTPECAISMDELLEEKPKLPKLLRAYLAIGAKICGPPAIDREFQTIDFLTLLDLEELSPTVKARFLG